MPSPAVIWDSRPASDCRSTPPSARQTLPRGFQPSGLGWEKSDWNTVCPPCVTLTAWNSALASHVPTPMNPCDGGASSVRFCGATSTGSTASPHALANMDWA